MKIVVKFGGSSLASAEQFKKVADIIHACIFRRASLPVSEIRRFELWKWYACYGTRLGNHRSYFL